MEECVWTTIGSIATAVAAIAAVVATITAWKSANASKATTLYHIIEDIRKDYRSSEMLLAVRTLHELYRQHPDNFVEEYDNKRKEEEAQVNNLPREERVKAEQNTLHYQRRLVSHFYQYVATLYVEHILPPDIVFKTWAESDLKIIPDIIVLIENKLRQVLHTPPLPPLNKEEPLLVLYRDSYNYELKRPKHISN